MARILYLGYNPILHHVFLNAHDNGYSIDKKSTVKEVTLGSLREMVDYLAADISEKHVTVKTNLPYEHAVLVETQVRAKVPRAEFIYDLPAAAALRLEEAEMRRQLSILQDSKEKVRGRYAEQEQQYKRALRPFEVFFVSSPDYFARADESLRTLGLNSQRFSYALHGYRDEEALLGMMDNPEEAVVVEANDDYPYRSVVNDVKKAGNPLLVVCATRDLMGSIGHIPKIMASSLDALANFVMEERAKRFEHEVARKAK